MLRQANGAFAAKESSCTLSVPRPLWTHLGIGWRAGEESQAAALREIQEETGLHIPLLRLVGVCPFLSNKQAASNWIFFAEVEQEEPIRLSQEHLDSNWMPLEDALSMKLAFKHHDILTVCLSLPPQIDRSFER